jgi:TolA-binding protein
MSDSNQTPDQTGSGNHDDAASLFGGDFNPFALIGSAYNASPFGVANNSQHNPPHSNDPHEHQRAEFEAGERQHQEQHRAEIEQLEARIAEQQTEFEARERQHLEQQQAKFEQLEELKARMMKLNKTFGILRMSAACLFFGLV